MPAPRFRTAPLPSELSHVRGYRHLQTFFPTLTKLVRLARWTSGDEIWMDHRWRITALDCSGTSGPCRVQVVENSEAGASGAKGAIMCDAYLKTTHLLDPIDWMKGRATLPRETGLPWHHKAWLRAWQKLQDPGNQAYIDAVACYALGRLAEEGVTPHFNIFYGAFCARADRYRYNLTEDFHTFRHERWFWKGVRHNRFAIRILDMTGDEAQSVSDSQVCEFLEQFGPEDIDGDAKSEGSESLSCEDVDEDASEGSLHSDDAMDDVGFAEEASDTSESDGSGSDEDDGSEEETMRIYAEFQNFPVMLILTQRSNGTMDALFDDPDAVGAAPGSAEWEARWTAWIFQVLAALSCVQTLFGLTHNDLHSNNIVWTNTTQTHLVYTNRAGQVFRVPTFGKLFRIIDFGRAIFTINGHRYISDDFKAGNDADGQYVFPPLSQKHEKEVPPNASFDLCRLAVSILDGIFPQKPAEVPNGAILSQEPGLKVIETVSPLYNLLWTWLLDSSGRNVFIEPDGSERFPDFGLYRHIAEFVHGAVPCQQFSHVAFQNFQISSAPSGTKPYSLFC